MQIKSKEIEIVSVGELIHHPKNMNEHSEDQINRLVKLIEYQGFRNPLVVQKGTNLVVAGNGRLMAARKMNLEEVPVTYQEFDSEAQLYAYMTSDNAIASWASLDLAKVNTEMLDLGPDFDIDMLGIKDFVIEPIEKFEAQSDEDEVPEVKHAITRRGDIWLLGNHKLLCGDSTMIDDVEKLMNGEKADLLLTDPPYNYGSETNCSKSNTGDNQLKNAGWDKNFSPSVVPFFDFLNDSYSAYIFTSAFLFGETISIAKEFSDFSGMMCWKKTTYNSNLIKKHPTWNIEPIVYATKGKHVFNYDDSDAKNALLEFAGEHSTRFEGHPSQKPVKMLESIIKNSSVVNSLILDLFLGSGSTLIACEKTNRKCYGMELDEGYVDVICQRWMNYTGRKDCTLEGTGQTYEELKAERDLTQQIN